MWIRSLLFLLPLVCGACAAQATLPPLTVGHPASPDAAEAPIVRSSTLDLPDATDSTGEATPPPAFPNDHPAGGHDGHAGHHHGS